MFGIDATEMLVIIIVAVVVIGPKDLPLAMRTAGRWIGKARKMSGHFRAGVDAMVREAELDDMEKTWRAQNEKIMREHPQGGPPQQPQTGAWPVPPASAEQLPSGAEARAVQPDAAPDAAPKA